MTWCLGILELAHRLSGVSIRVRLPTGSSIIVGWHSGYTSKGAIVGCIIRLIVRERSPYGRWHGLCLGQCCIPPTLVDRQMIR